MIKPSLLFILLITLKISGQRNISPTDTLRIIDENHNEKSFSINDLDTFVKRTIPDLNITNQRGENKKAIVNLKGILLKDILKQFEIKVDKPKYLNEFYFLFIASDGYKVVFSWNEIFNSEIGNNVFIISEMNGEEIRDMDERILLISSKDINTGRRFIKGLDKIIIARVE